jgi:hypothetical protein
MAKLDKRLTDLEGKQSSADLGVLTVERLDAHLGTLTPGTLEWFRVMLAGIWGKGSRLPIKKEGF